MKYIYHVYFLQLFKFWNVILAKSIVNQRVHDWKFNSLLIKTSLFTSNEAKTGDNIKCFMLNFFFCFVKYLI